MYAVLVTYLPNKFLMYPGNPKYNTMKCHELVQHTSCQRCGPYCKKYPIAYGTCERMKGKFFFGHTRFPTDEIVRVMGFFLWVSTVSH